MEGVMLHQYLAQSGGKEKILGGLDEFWNAFPPGIADTLQRDFFFFKWLPRISIYMCKVYTRTCSVCAQ